MSDVLALRIAARFQRLSDQAPGKREDARRNTNPINAPKGIDRALVRDQGRTDYDQEEAVRSDRRDIQPKDVFSPQSGSMGVLNLAETGKSLEKALNNQVPKDKGWDTVKNLSQYLIRTEGGGGTKPAGSKG